MESESLVTNPLKFQASLAAFMSGLKQVGIPFTLL
jgi:hypothetical protein